MPFWNKRQSDEEKREAQEERRYRQIRLEIQESEQRAQQRKASGEEFFDRATSTFKFLNPYMPDGPELPEKMLNEPLLTTISNLRGRKGILAATTTPPAGLTTMAALNRCLDSLEEYVFDPSWETYTRVTDDYMEATRLYIEQFGER